MLTVDILALHPVYRGSLKRVRWEVDFKSDRVAKSVIEKLTDSEQEDDEIRRQIRLFKNIPEARGLAGWLV